MTPTHQGKAADATRSLRWSAGAIEDWDALKRCEDGNRIIWLGQALIALAIGTRPGSSVLGRALRDPSGIWGHLSTHIEGRFGPGVQGRIGFRIEQLELEVERLAREDGVAVVGERHIAAALPRGETGLPDYSIKPDALLKAVREAELGPDFEPSELRDRWHGVIDVNIVVHYRDIWSIDWSTLTRSPAVTIWATTALLDELDDLAYQERKARAWSRAKAFNRWIRPRLPEGMTPAGVTMDNGAQLRVWVAPESSRPPDSRHLDAAEALVERSVPVHIVTGDNGMLARAISRGLPTLDVSSELLDERGTQ